MTQGVLRSEMRKPTPKKMIALIMASYLREEEKSGASNLQASGSYGIYKTESSAVVAYGMPDVQAGFAMNSK
jgi:hypothetical protein